MMMKVEGMEWGTYFGSNFFFRHQTFNFEFGDLKGKLREEKAIEGK